ncbi:MAG: SWIM zinc finger family protein [Desulfatiglandales bacterium]
MGQRGYRGYFWYEPASPREVKGGIKAHSKRGTFATQWWGKRWLQVLESFNIGARLARGRSYARKGQVADLEIKKGEIRASVQGSRSGAYQVSIKLKRITPANWKKIAGAFAERPIFMTRMLAGEMPPHIEEIFDEAGIPLFPRKQGDLKTDCSCPDWSNPCKHIAAVYYLLAEQFDRDPFLLFRLRGLTREELFDLLTGGMDSGPRAGRREPVERQAPEAYPPEALPDDPEVFWQAKVPVAPAPAEPSIPVIAAALPRRLGGFPFWRGNEDLLEVLSEIYDEASSASFEMISGEDEGF